MATVTRQAILQEVCWTGTDEVTSRFASDVRVGFLEFTVPGTRGKIEFRVPSRNPADTEVKRQYLVVLPIAPRPRRSRRSGYR
ncbi:MAG: hypothetical protein SP1CHLAM54_03580 [Chlamydiia bacterium]|nr:hypothetical protein [Chlamydiia bacterium]MCH9615274.1 hypothetical protein [Chlamydiia bacterium]MCH9628404.1 hypothetical protein [Chlamydiia bacterium]